MSSIDKSHDATIYSFRRNRDVGWAIHREPRDMMHVGLSFKFAMTDGERGTGRPVERRVEVSAKGGTPNADKANHPLNPARFHLLVGLASTYSSSSCSRSIIVAVRSARRWCGVAILEYDVRGCTAVSRAVIFAAAERRKYPSCR